MLIAILVAFACGCGGATVRETVSPFAAAVNHSQNEVSDALEQAHQAEEDLDAVAFRLRYNPVECDCPAWEIELRGEWTRILLTTEDDELLGALFERARDDEQERTFATYAVVGGLGRDWATASTGMRYRMLNVLDWTEGVETVDRQRVD